MSLAPFQKKLSIICASSNGEKHPTDVKKKFTAPLEYSSKFVPSAFANHCMMYSIRKAAAGAVCAVSQLRFKLLISEQGGADKL
jgi:hypothetical protein